MIKVKVKISRWNRPRRSRAAGAWRWPTTASSAKVEERVELNLYSPSGSLSDTEQIKCSHHFVRFLLSRHHHLHLVTSSQVVLTRCRQEGGRPVTSCRGQSEPNCLWNVSTAHNVTVFPYCRTSDVSVSLLGGANIPSCYFTDQFSRRPTKLDRLRQYELPVQDRSIVVMFVQSMELADRHVTQLSTCLE